MSVLVFSRTLCCVDSACLTNNGELFVDCKRLKKIRLILSLMSKMLKAIGVLYQYTRMDIIMSIINL